MGQCVLRMTMLVFFLFQVASFQFFQHSPVDLTVSANNISPSSSLKSISLRRSFALPNPFQYSRQIRKSFCPLLVVSHDASSSGTGCPPFQVRSFRLHWVISIHNMYGRDYFVDTESYIRILTGLGSKEALPANKSCCVSWWSGIMDTQTRWIEGALPYYLFRCQRCRGRCPGRGQCTGALWLSTLISGLSLQIRLDLGCPNSHVTILIMQFHSSRNICTLFRERKVQFVILMLQSRIRVQILLFGRKLKSLIFWKSLPRERV